MGFFGNMFSLSRWSAPKSSVMNTITPVQFSRAKADIQALRDALSEMENAWYPHRVRYIRIAIDTILNGHVHACIERRDNLTLLKEFEFVSGETVDEETTKLFKEFDWFFQYRKYAKQAKYFGYSCVELGDMVNGSFPYLRLIPREFISPDRMNIAPFTYSIAGTSILEGEYAKWLCWIDTPSDKGTSTCGYGLLYKVAHYEILLRNLLGQNATFVELFGQPIRWLKTSKTQGEPEYRQAQAAMKDMGSSASLITDLQDELEIIGGSEGKGKGSNIFGDFNDRLEKVISKIILGHADALDSTPGKLGGNQDGKTSAVAQAFEDIEILDGKEDERLVNEILIPKLIAIGFPIKLGLCYRLKNDKEKEEVRERSDTANGITATFLKTMSEAGYDVTDEKWISDRVGVSVKKKEVQPAVIDKATADKIKNYYGA